MASRSAIVKWLLDSDPSIRWQVMRDLTDEPAEIVAAERSRVATEGWGAKLLGMQTADGHWGDDQRHGWMVTNDALALLKDFGADPADEPVRKAIGLVRERIAWWQLDGRPFFDGETEACINGRILAAGAYFGAASDQLSTACSASSSRMAAGTARLRLARDPRSIPRSASWKGFWSTRRRRALRPR